MDEIYLKHVIDHSREAGGRLVLVGDLTEATIAQLTEKLDAVGARPHIADTSGIRFADAAAIAALSRWVRRSGMTALRMVNAPRQLVALIGRYGLDTTLPAAVAPPHRNLLAA